MATEQLSLENTDYKWQSPIIEISGKYRFVAMPGKQPKNLRTKTGWMAAMMQSNTQPGPRPTGPSDQGEVRIDFLCPVSIKQ